MEDVIAGRSNTQNHQSKVSSIQLLRCDQKKTQITKNTDQSDFNGLISNSNDFGYKWLSLYCVENYVLSAQKMTLDGIAYISSHFIHMSKPVAGVYVQSKSIEFDDSPSQSATHRI